MSNQIIENGLLLVVNKVCTTSGKLETAMKGEILITSEGIDVLWSVKMFQKNVLERFCTWFNAWEIKSRREDLIMKFWHSVFEVWNWNKCVFPVYTDHIEQKHCMQEIVTDRKRLQRVFEPVIYTAGNAWGNKFFLVWKVVSCKKPFSFLLFFCCLYPLNICRDGQNWNKAGYYSISEMRTISMGSMKRLVVFSALEYLPWSALHCMSKRGTARRNRTQQLENGFV